MPSEHEDKNSLSKYKPVPLLSQLKSPNQMDVTTGMLRMGFEAERFFKETRPNRRGATLARLIRHQIHECLGGRAQPKLFFHFIELGTEFIKGSRHHNQRKENMEACVYLYQTYGAKPVHEWPCYKTWDQLVTHMTKKIGTLSASPSA